METYDLKNEIKAFGPEVKNFPDGVAEAFHQLIQLLPAGNERSYFGIFQRDTQGNMHYRAAAEEMYEGEAEKYEYDRVFIEKGEYLAEPIVDWQKKIECIKDVFMKMMNDPRVDKNKPGIEWYKNENEMLCMLRCAQPN